MAQTWLVQGKLPDAIGVIDWLDDKVLEIDRDRVHRVILEHPDGAVVRVGKKKPSQRTFDLLDVPEGTVKARLYRGLRVMREQLERSGLAAEISGGMS